MTTDPTLTARFEKADSTLRVEYTVFNPGRDTIFLTNHACRYGPSGPVPDRNETFVFIEDRVVHVTKRVPPPPAAFHNPIPHFVTPLSPDQEFSETVVLDLPIQPRIPYRRVRLSGLEVEATHVYLSIGYRVASPSLRVVPTERAGQKVFFLRVVRERETASPPAGRTLPAEQLLVTPRERLPLRVLPGVPQTI